MLNERHLRAVLSEFLRYYNHDRPHRTSRLDMPVTRPPTPTGAVVSRRVLGGLNHAYGPGGLNPDGILPPYNTPQELAVIRDFLRRGRAVVDGVVARMSAGQGGRNRD